MTLLHTMESETQAPTNLEVELPAPHELTEKQRAFAANVFNAYVKTMSDSDRLSALYTIDTERYESEIKEKVEEFLNEDQEYLELMSKIKDARKYDREGGLPYMPEVKERNKNARELIVSSLNLPEISGADEIELATNNVQNLLKDVPKEPNNKDLALLILGAKTPKEDEPGEFEYTFPYELFPHKINDKWVDYLDTVKDHLEAEKAHIKAPTEETSNEMATIDNMRRQKHTALTRAIHPILGLEKFDYSFENTMQLLAKMRTDELMLERKSHPSARHKTAQEKAIEKKMTRKTYDH